MTTSTLRVKLKNYIETVDDKKIKAIYTILENEVEEASNYWQDEDFVKDLKKQSSDFKKGLLKSENWEDVKLRLLAKVK